MAGPFAISNADGNRTIDPLSEAPASDTGQVALPVRVISQLGAGTGGGATGGLTDAQLRATPVPTRASDGTRTLTLLDAAPASDTGQVAIPVRVVSQLGAGSGGSSGGLTNTELRASPVPVSGFPVTQPVSGTVNIGNLPAVQPVSGTVQVGNFPGTQPVSGPLTDTQLRAAAVPVNVGNFPASQPVTGTFWQPTQPVSGTVAISGPVLEQPASLAQSVTGAAAAAVTATLPAVSGQFHYISRINIIAYATVARTGVAAPVVVTSTNLPGSLAWTTPTAAAVGTQYETDIQLTSPLKSSAANTATTIVAPGTASVIWRINVIYYTGP